MSEPEYQSSRGWPNTRMSGASISTAQLLRLRASVFKSCGAWTIEKGVIWGEIMPVCDVFESQNCRAISRQFQGSRVDDIGETLRRTSRRAARPRCSLENQQPPQRSAVGEGEVAVRGPVPCSRPTIPRGVAASAAAGGKKSPYNAAKGREPKRQRRGPGAGNVRARRDARQQPNSCRRRAAGSAYISGHDAVLLSTAGKGIVFPSEP
jgi:hypothetical protein